MYVKGHTASEIETREANNTKDILKDNWMYDDGISRPCGDAAVIFKGQLYDTHTRSHNVKMKKKKNWKKTRAY